jgi:hypothetical protein
MMTRLTIFILMCLPTLSAEGQVTDNEKRQRVLKEEIADSLFIFGKWTAGGQTQTELKYLGKVRTKDGRVFKIMNSCWIWGLSHRATNRILIFNDQNQYVGNYGLTTTDDLPDKLEEGKLIFTNYDSDNCDKKLVTKINFSHGLPKEIFIKCTDEYGDIYPFSPE